MIFTTYLSKKLDKACFRDDMAYSDFKDLPRWTAFAYVLRDKAFNIVKKPKYDGYKCWLTSMFNKFSDKKISSRQRPELPELHEIRKIKLCHLATIRRITQTNY